MARRARKNQEVTLGRRQRRRKEQRRKNVKEVIGTILYLVILCAIVYFILHYVGQRTVVRGDSMDTTLSDGQNLIMDKLSYRFHEPERSLSASTASEKRLQSANLPQCTKRTDVP